MDQHNATPEIEERSSVARRTVLKGAAGVAWTVPVVVALGTTVAAAASTDFAFTDLSPTLINVANNTPPASITVSGTGPDNANIALSVGDTAWGTATVTDGAWSAEIPAGSLPEGSNVVVSASSGTWSDTKTYTKDIVAPTVEATQVIISTNNKDYTVSGTMSEEGTVVVSVTGLTPGTVSYPTATTWQATFTKGSNDSYSGTVTATDLVGNASAADTFNWPKNARSPYAL